MSFDYRKRPGATPAELFLVSAWAFISIGGLLALALVTTWQAGWKIGICASIVFVPIILILGISVIVGYKDWMKERRNKCTKTSLSAPS